MSRVVSETVLEVRWRDLDAFNHVNNASYLGYIEEARVRWFKSLSQDWAGETAAPIMAASAGLAASIASRTDTRATPIVPSISTASAPLAAQARIASCQPG